MNTVSPVDDVFIMDAARLSRDTIEALDCIREHDPIYWSEKSQCWLITRHEDNVQGFSGDLPLSIDRLGMFSFSSIPIAEQPGRIPNLLRYATQFSVNIDPPAHTRVRKLLVKAFNRKVVEDTRPFVISKVQELMEFAAARGGKVEFVEEIARKLPASVILRLLGFPQSYLPEMKHWANSLIGALASSRPPPEMHDEAEKVTVHMAQVARDEMAKRRVEPQEDLLTQLVRAHDDDDRLSDDELIGNLILLIVAGHDTTSNTLTLVTHALAEHPQCWEFMYAHPEKLAACADELMRYVQMSFVQPRVASEDFVWNGKAIKRGQIVMLLQGVGNRDPRVFAAPDAINFERSNDSVLTFGPGLHHCLGHQLAKMQVIEFLSALVSRFKSVKVLDKELRFMPQIGFRGLYEMNVRFDPR